MNSGIREIARESGVGKSQNCFQLSLMAVQFAAAHGGLEKAANRMPKIAHELQTISRKYRCAVVCLNQVIFQNLSLNT